MKQEIQKFIDEDINPALAGHGGFLEIADFNDEHNDIYVTMGGGCQGCAASAETLYTQIASYLREEFPNLGKIIDVTDHDAGLNPHFAKN